MARRRSSASGTIESGNDHGHLQHLFLKERHAERAFEDGFEFRVNVIDGLAAGAAIEVRMHQSANNGAGTNDGNFNDDIVKRLRFHARQRRHLCAAFDLENANRIRFLHHLEGRGVVHGKPGKIDFPVLAALGTERDGFFDRGHHSQS